MKPNPNMDDAMRERAAKDALELHNHITPYLAESFDKAIEVWKIQPEEAERMFNVYRAGSAASCLIWQVALEREGLYARVMPLVIEEAKNLARKIISKMIPDVIGALKRATGGDAAWTNMKKSQDEDDSEES